MGEGPDGTFRVRSKRLTAAYRRNPLLVFNVLISQPHIRTRDKGPGRFACSGQWEQRGAMRGAPQAPLSEEERRMPPESTNPKQPDKPLEKIDVIATTIKQIRQMRVQSEKSGFGVLAYLLRMAEIEALDIASGFRASGRSDRSDR